MNKERKTKLGKLLDSITSWNIFDDIISEFTCNLIDKTKWYCTGGESKDPDGVTMLRGLIVDLETNDVYRWGFSSRCVKDASKEWLWEVTCTQQVECIHMAKVQQKIRAKKAWDSFQVVIG